MSAGLYPVAAELHEVSFTSGPVDLRAPPPEVWSVVGDFFDLTWLDPNLSLERLGEGDRRRVNVGQASVVNQLLGKTDHSYSYSLVESSLPVTHYQATLEVRPHEDANCCVFEWHGLARTSGPVDEARRALEPVYQAVRGVLQDTFNREHAMQSGISLNLATEHSGGSFFKVVSKP